MHTFKLNAQQQAIVDAGAALARQADLTGHYAPAELVRRQTFEASSGVPKAVVPRGVKRQRVRIFGVIEQDADGTVV